MRWKAKCGSLHWFRRGGGEEEAAAAAAAAAAAEEEEELSLCVLNNSCLYLLIRGENYS